MRKLALALLVLACTAVAGCRLNQRIDSAIRSGIASGSVNVVPSGPLLGNN